MDPAIERRIADRARDQHGCITSAQLHEIGMSPSTRRRRVDGGLLVPVGVRTYRLASAPATAEAMLKAACLDLDGVASHESAAWLHGLRPAPPQQPEVTVTKGRSPSPRASARVRVHTSTSLHPEDLLRVRGIPVTSVARTLLGLAALVPERLSRSELLSLLELAIRERKASERWLWWHLERRRVRGRNGVRALESVLAERCGLGPTESWLEREMLTTIAAAGLPAPDVQVRIGRRGRFAARVDLLYPDQRLVIEVLGHRWHSTREQLRADTERATALQLEGYVVVQITYDQLIAAPGSAVASIRRALTQARRAA